jgi:hypothetical protein
VVLSNLNTNMGFFPLGKLMTGDFRTAFTLVFTWIFLVVLWWRGATLAHNEASLDTIRSIFQWGLAVVFIAVLLDSLTPLEVVNGFLILGFFAVGLAGLSLARFSSEIGDARVLPRDWLLPIGASVGLVLVLGLLISGLGLGGLDDVTRGILGLVGTVGGWILTPILLGMGYIAAALVLLANWLTSVFGGGDLTGLQEAQRQLEEFHETLGQGERSGPPRLLTALLKGVAFLVGCAVVGFVLYQIFRFRRMLREKGEVEEVRESLFSWRRVNDDLSGWLNGWWGRLVHAATGQDRRPPEAPRDPREVYHRFLALAAVLGRPRSPAQTPREHQQVVGDRLPVLPADRVVDSFQVTHYGHRQFSAPDLDRLLTDWNAIEQYGMEQLAREKEAEASKETGSGSS